MYVFFCIYVLEFASVSMCGESAMFNLTFLLFYVTFYFYLVYNFIINNNKCAKVQQASYSHQRDETFRTRQTAADYLVVNNLCNTHSSILTTFSCAIASDGQNRTTNVYVQQSFVARLW